MTDVSFPLLAAGVLGLLGAAVHGLGGELWVVRRFDAQKMPSTRFGGGRMTMAMMHVSWHITTVAFLGVGVALLVAALGPQDDVSRALAVLAAGLATGFAGVMMCLGAAYMRSPRFLIQHVGPVAFTAIAGLGWWGAL